MLEGNNRSSARPRSPGRVHSRLLSRSVYFSISYVIKSFTSGILCIGESVYIMLPTYKSRDASGSACGRWTSRFYVYRASAQSLRREQKVPLECIHDHEQLSEFGFFHQAACSHHVDKIPTQNQLLASSWAPVRSPVTNSMPMFHSDVLYCIVLCIIPGHIISE